MKIVAILLSVSCLIDIIFPIKKVVKSYIKAKKNGAKTESINLKKFYFVELMNYIALIFFIIFILKY